MQKTQNNAKNIALAGIFSAIIIMLQLACAIPTPLPVSITLTLVPVVLGGAIMGVKYAAVLGAAFGLAAFTFSVFGWLGAGGVVMFNASPVLFFVTAMVKGILAAVASAFVFSKLKKVNLYFAVLVAAMVAPIVNTGTFVIFFVLGYRDLLVQWAGGADIFGFLITGIVGINFVLEFALNVLLAPVILRVIVAVKGNK